MVKMVPTTSSDRSLAVLTSVFEFTHYRSYRIDLFCHLTFFETFTINSVSTSAWLVNLDVVKVIQNLLNGGHAVVIFICEYFPTKFTHI